MVKSAKHGGRVEGGQKAIRVKTQTGAQHLTVRGSAAKGAVAAASCGCLCTPESSASLLTTVK